MIHKKSMMQSLALAGLMTGINAIIILISSYTATFLIADLFLMLFLPFISTFTFIFCERKMAFCYFFASLAICLLINIEKTIFYLIPGLISGLLFAVLLNKKMHGLYIVIITGFVNTFVIWGLFWISQWFFKISMSAAFQALFGLSEQQAQTLFPVFIALSAFAQTIISAFIIFNELKKFEVFINFDDSPFKILFYTAAGFSFVGGVTMYFLKDVASLCLGIGLVASLPAFYYMYKQKRYWWTLIMIATLVFGFAIFSTILPGYGYLSLCYWTLLLAISGLYFYYYAHRF